MDINNFINNEGIITVPNPNYNPRSKKNTEPSTLDVIDRGANRHIILDIAHRDFENQYSVDEKTYNKYARYGLKYNPQEYNSGSLDVQLAEAQSNWSKAFNALAQTVVSEIGLGTLEGFVDIFDFVASKALSVGNDDYQSEVSNTIKEWQDTFRNEIAPIYSKPGSGFENGTDFGWWMQNIPNVASAITLLIPTRAISSGAKLLGKALHAGEAASKVRRWAGAAKRVERGEELNAFQKAMNNPISIAKRNAAYRTTSEALLMRTMENYQEARDVNVQTYDNSLDYFNHKSDKEFNDWVNDNAGLFDGEDLNNITRDKAAKAIAKKAADRTFTMDFSNVIFDIIQLHGLKNIGKGVKELGRNGGNRSVRAAQQASIEDAGSLATNNVAKAADKAVENISKTRRILNATGDIVKRNAKTVLEESTEGIEEAVNYIAQQEGITYGKALLEGKGKDYNVVNIPTWAQWATLGLANVANAANVINTWNNLQNPLNDYLKDAELQESAFWGMIGGWVFGLGGNAFNAIDRYKDAKELQKLQEINPRTGEKTNIKSDNLAWLEMLDMPENKAAKLAISQRQFHLSKLKGDLESIEKGENIFADKDENDKFPTFSSNDEKEAARIKAISNYQTQVVLDAINSGTYEMLLDYWQSDNVKNAMISLGITDETTADKDIASFVNLAEDIKNLYNTQASRVMSQVEYLNATAKYGYEIPLQYVQQIAKQNVNRLLDIREFDREIISLNELIGREERIMEEQYGSDFNATEEKSRIKLQHLIDLYTKLDVEERDIKRNKTLDFNTARTLNNIKKQKEYIIKSLNSIDGGISNVIAAISTSNEFEKVINETGASTLGKNTFKKTDAEIVKEAKNLTSYNQTNVDDDVLINSANKIINDIKDKRDGTDLADRNTDLFRKYHKLADLELSKDISKDYIATTRQQIEEEVNYIHNLNNTARKEVILAAEKNIRELFNNHLDDEHFVRNINEVLAWAYDNDYKTAREVASNIMSEEEVNKLFNTLETLNLTGKANTQVYDYLTRILGMLIENRNQNRENSSTSQNSNSEDEIVGSKEYKEDDKKLNKERKTGQSDDLKSDGLTNADESTESTDSDNKTITIGEHTYPIVETQDGDYVIDTTNADPTFIRNLVNDDLIVLSDDVDVLEDEVEVTELPVIGFENNDTTNPPILKKAGIGNKKVSDEGATEPEIVKSDQSSELRPISSTGDEGKTSSQPDSTDVPELSTFSQEEIDSKILEEVNNLFSYNIDSLSNISLDDFETISTNLRNTLLDNEFAKQYNEEDVLRVFDSRVELMRNAINKLSALKHKIQKDGYALGTIANESRIEELEFINYDSLFVNTFDSFMREYQKITYMPTVDGKQIVNLEDVLRICNQSFNAVDSTMAKNLYDMIVSYLNTAYGKSKYIIEDSFKSKSDIIADAAINAQQLRDRNDNTEFSEERVNIYDLIKFYENEDNVNKDKFFEILNNLKVGDKLNVRKTKYTYNNSEKHVLELVKDNIVIGELPVPKIDGSKYVVVNNGWVTDVELDSNGQVISNCKNIIENIFLSNEDDTLDLKEILIKYSLRDNADNSDLIKQFRNNPIITKLVEESITNRSKGTNVLFINKETNDIDADRVLDLLARLWKYSNFASNRITKEDTANAIRASLNRWFDKRYDTYNNIYSIYNDDSNTEFEVDVTRMNAGELTKVFNEQKDRKSIKTEEGYKEANYPSEAIADRNVSKIGIFTGSGRLAVSDYGYRSVNGYNKGDTELVTLDGNNHPYFAKAIGAILEYEEPGTQCEKIVNAAASYISSKVKTLGNDIYSDKAFDDLEEALNNVFATRTNNNVGILRARSGSIYVNRKKDGPLEYIEVSCNKFNFKIYRHDKTRQVLGISKNFGIVDGKIQLYYDNETNKIKNKQQFDGAKGSTKNSMVKDIMTSVLRFAAVQTNIDISKKGIESDIKGTSLGGFFTRTENGIIVDIPAGDKSFHGEYKSYNDFLLDNNLIKVNLQKINGKNFIRRGNSQLRNQTLYVSLPKAKKSNRKDNTTNTSSKVNKVNRDVVLNTTVEETRNEVKSIIENNKESAGKNIVKTVLDSDDYNRFMEVISNEFNILDYILPTNITYKPELNWYDPNTGDSKGSTAYARGNRKSAKYAIFDDFGNIVRGVRFKQNEEIIIGPRLLNHLSDTRKNKRYLGIRKLIHEQLHNSIQSNENDRIQLLSAIAPIYEEFKNHIDNELKSNISDDKRILLNHIKKTIYGYKGDRLLEEFLVESLTNIEFVNYLNSVEVADEQLSTKENLFTKIIKALAKFFGWDVKENTLYAKEFNALANILNDSEPISSIDNEENSNEDSSITHVEESEKEPAKPTQTEPKPQPKPIKSPREAFYEEDEDDESNLSQIDELDEEEISIISKNNYDDYIYVPNANSLRDKLPDDLQMKFDDFKNNGIINIKCK